MALAAKYGEGVDFDRAKPEDKVELATWLEEHPQSYWGLRTQCQAFISAKKWDEALAVAEKLREMLPDDRSNEGVYALLASIHRGKGNEVEERSSLLELSSRSSDCREALVRLMEIDEKRGDWPSLVQWCEQMQAINPVRSDLQRLRSMAYEKVGNPAKAAEALAASLDLQPTDPANIHYRLAVAHNAIGQTKLAKRQVLMALEESPRYRDALKLLLEINKESESGSSSSTKGTEEP